MAYQRVLSRILLVAMLGLATSATGCVEPPESTIGAPVQQGGVSVTVTSVDMAYLDLEGPEGAAQTQTPVLRVFLTVNNASPAPLRYDLGWSANVSTQASSPLLFVDPGPDQPLSPTGNIRALRLADMNWPGDPIAEATSIAAGETREDVLLFEVPEAGVSSLVLSLPPGMFGPEVKTPAFVRFPWAAAEVAPPAPVGLGEAWTGENYTFKVTGIEQSFLRLESPTAPRGGFTNAPVLRVNFEVTNNGTDALTYMPPEANRTIGAPVLTTGDGSSIARVQLPTGSTSPGHVTERTNIAAGATFTGAFLFEQPAASVTRLNLQLPGKRFDSTGLIRVAFDFAHQSVPVPPELTPVTIQEGSGAATATP